MIKKYIALFLVCCMAQPMHATKPVSTTSYLGNKYGWLIPVLTAGFFGVASDNHKNKINKLSGELTALKMKKVLKKLYKKKLTKELSEDEKDEIAKAKFTIYICGGSLQKPKEVTNKRKKDEDEDEDEAHNKKIKAHLRNARIKMWIYRALAAASLGIAGYWSIRNIAGYIKSIELTPQQNTMQGIGISKLVDFFSENTVQSGDTHKLPPEQETEVIKFMENYGWNENETKKILHETAENKDAPINKILRRKHQTTERTSAQ